MSAVVVWLLMLSAGGEGVHAHVLPASPIGLYQSYEECRVARDKRLADYRAFLNPPLKSGPGWVEGTVSVIGGSVSGPGRGLGPTISTQFYLFTCEAKRVQ